MYGLVMAIVFVLIVLWGAYTVTRIVMKSKAEKRAAEEELYGDAEDAEVDES